MRYFLFAVLILFAVPLSAVAQEGVKVVQVKGNIHMLISPKGGNVVASLGEDGTFVIDDQLAGRSEIVENAIKAIGEQDIQFVLNTHYHFDHSGGNEFFGEKGTIIVAHDNVRKRLGTEQFITYFKRAMPPLSKAGLPSVTFSKDMSFHYNGDRIRILHVPAAHTDGDAVAYFENANVLVTGDTVFNGRYPFIDVEHGGSIKGLLAAIDVFLGMIDDETIVAPGHGGLMSKADLQAYRDVLATVSGRVEVAVQEGKALDEVLAANLSQEYDVKMGQGIVAPDAFITILYGDLKR